MSGRLPSDPYMLLSVLNTKLRDEYESLDRLCEDLELDQAGIIARLEAVGFTYDPERNRFR